MERCSTPQGVSYPLRKSLIMIFRGEIRKHIFKGVFDDRKALCNGIASLRASNGDFITPFEKIPLTFRFGDLSSQYA